jgi:hypothetical protein
VLVAPNLAHWRGSDALRELLHMSWPSRPRGHSQAIQTISSNISVSNRQCLLGGSGSCTHSWDFGGGRSMGRRTSATGPLAGSSAVRSNTAFFSCSPTCMVCFDPAATVSEVRAALSEFPASMDPELHSTGFQNDPTHVSV